MSAGVHSLVLGLLIIAGSVWLGGYVAIAVVARASSRALDPDSRVTLFRQLGRSYLKVGVAALVVSYAAGAVLLAGHDWDGVLIATVVTAVVLVAVLIIAVRQAQRMTRLRASAADNPEPSNPGPISPDLASTISRQAHLAVALRTLIGLLSLALVILAVLLA